MIASTHIAMPTVNRPQRELTLLDLLTAIDEVGTTDEEAILTVVHMLKTGLARPLGVYRDTRGHRQTRH